MLSSKQLGVQKQSMSVSQSTIQSCAVLAMGVEALSAYVHDAVTDNPLISFESLAGHRDGDCAPELQYRLAGGSVQGTCCDIFGGPADRDTDLRRSLMLQLPGSCFGTRRERILLFLIDSIDGDGYFREPVDAVASTLDCSREEIESCLSLIREMDPPGVGAADLRDCLLLQLKRSHPREHIAIAIADRYLEPLAKNSLRLIAGQLDCSLSQVHGAAELIKSLDPRPGAIYSELQPQYITPDVVVSCADGDYSVALSRDVQYELRVDREYLSYLRGCDDPEVKSYVQEKYQQAQAISRCIEKRNSTLLLVAQDIFEMQKAFFYRGPEYLRPLKMRQLAERLSCHESTVSRAVKDKYLSCPWGCFPMSYFFSNALDCEEGNYTCNPRAMIKKYISGEDKAAPLNDGELVDRLSTAGLALSRRTVAKYREQMGIPNAHLRRRYVCK